MVPLGANAKIHFLGPGLRQQLHKLSWGWVWSIDQDAIPDWWFEDPLIFEILLSHCFPSWHNCGPATDFSAQWACFSLKPWIALQNQCQWFATYSQPQGSLADLLRPWTQWLNHWTLKRSNPSSKWMLGRWLSQRSIAQIGWAELGQSWPSSPENLAQVGWLQGCWLMQSWVASLLGDVPKLSFLWGWGVAGTRGPIIMSGPAGACSSSSAKTVLLPVALAHKGTWSENPMTKLDLAERTELVLSLLLSASDCWDAHVASHSVWSNSCQVSLVLVWASVWEMLATNSVDMCLASSHSTSWSLDFSCNAQSCRSSFSCLPIP